MTSIIRATVEHASTILEIGKTAWIGAHGHSASKEDIDQYISRNYTEDALQAELLEISNIYHIIYHHQEPAGFSKLKLDNPNVNLEPQNTATLDRIYLSKAFQGKNLGSKLIDFNLSYAQNNEQAGIWLAVWVENAKAINFYSKIGFQIAGKYDFQISPSHTNPNHIMYLDFDKKKVEVSKDSDLLV